MFVLRSAIIYMNGSCLFYDMLYNNCLFFIQPQTGDFLYSEVKTGYFKLSERHQS
jgi:hypothetical protein